MRNFNREKTACKLGHPLSGDNVYVRKNGSRECWACHCRRQNEYAARQAAKRRARQTVEKLEVVKAIDPAVLLFREHLAVFQAKEAERVAAFRAKIHERASLREYVNAIAPRDAA